MTRGLLKANGLKLGRHNGEWCVMTDDTGSHTPTRIGRPVTPRRLPAVSTQTPRINK
jgi:hypothetical protein